MSCRVSRYGEEVVERGRHGVREVRGGGGEGGARQVV